MMLDYSQLLISLIMVVLFIVGLAFVVQKLNPQRLALSGPIKMLTATAVGARERICLVQAGDSYLLVGITPQSIQTLQILTPEQAKVIQQHPQYTAKSNVLGQWFGAKA